MQESLIPTKREKALNEIERQLWLKWQDKPATEKQRRLLSKLGISFNPDLSKGDAFLSLSKRLNHPKSRGQE
ncbi:MAG: hypothetical protein K2X81_22485 [Candidatus Obscuribacterales bacterium]|nr:hypothetical protein [Candidatus Obscuribacterales bacterium]